MPDNNPISTETPADDSMEELGAIVLCGGQSTRLGIDKTELIFRDQTFLERVVGQVGEIAQQVVLVGRINPESHRLSKNITLVQDERENAGPLEGIRVGLKALAEKGIPLAFVTSCDVPLLKPELILFLLDQLGDHPAIVPIDGQRVYGMTAIYQTGLHFQIEKRIAENQLRVSELAEAFSAKQISVEQLRGVDPNL